MEDKFQRASSYIAKTKDDPALRSLSQDQQLLFYALYKQGTVGPCQTVKPGIFDQVGRAKWDAWKRLGDLDKLTAQKNYVDLLARISSNWVQWELLQQEKDTQVRSTSSSSTESESQTSEPLEKQGVEDEKSPCEDKKTELETQTDASQLHQHVLSLKNRLQELVSDKPRPADVKDVGVFLELLGTVKQIEKAVDVAEAHQRKEKAAIQKQLNTLREKQRDMNFSLINSPWAYVAIAFVLLLIWRKR